VENEPKRRSLTPLQSELTIQPNAAPARPSAWRRLRGTRRQRPVPTTRGGIILGGIKRFLYTMLALGAAVSIGALALVWLADVDVKTAFMIMFFAGGILLVGGGVFSTADMGGSDWYWTQHEKDQRVGYSFVFVAVGLPLLAAGFLLEAL
jgi:hypothetical protein